MPNVKDTASAGPVSRRMLVVDDEQGIGDFIAEAARMNGLLCEVATTADDFLAAFGGHECLIMLDLMLPETDGIELLRHLQRHGCTAPIVLMSGYDRRVLRTAEELAQELGLRVLGRLVKPFRLSQLCDLFEAAIALHEADLRPRQKPAYVTTPADLAAAIADDAFVLHYQPQVDLMSRRVVGIEALVRWQTAQGLIYPDSFIPVAEAHGLIEELTWLIARRAFRERKRYAEKYPDLALSLNISATSLVNLAFPDALIKCAESYRVPPSSLVLEITESGLIVDLVHALDVLARLRMKGMRLSIDDFGTGYSMMNQLRRVPATELKIDKCFIRDMQADDSAWAVVRNTIELGHELGMSILAEGVETEMQVELLAKLGSDVGQGYFFCRPLPVHLLYDWLNARLGRA